jgi:hypothetical protein
MVPLHGDAVGAGEVVVSEGEATEFAAAGDALAGVVPGIAVNPATPMATRARLASETPQVFARFGRLNPPVALTDPPFCYPSGPGTVAGAKAGHKLVLS